MKQKVCAFVFLASFAAVHANLKVVATSFAPRQATQSNCQVKSGQIWRGVMQRMKSSYGMYQETYCTVEARVNLIVMPNALVTDNALTITNVSYLACMSAKYCDPKYGPKGCTGTPTPTGIPSLPCHSKSAPLRSGVCFSGTLNSSTCNTTKFRPTDIGVPLRGGIIRSAGSSINGDAGSLEVNMKFVTGNFGSALEYYDDAFTFFQSPELLPDGITIQSRETGLCMDLLGGDVTNGNYLSLSKCMDHQSNAYQKWKFVDGQLIYANSTIPKCVDLIAGNVSNGQRLEIWDCAGTPQQQWRYDASQGIIYLASQLGSGPLKCIDLRDGGKDGKNALQVWDCNYGAWNQQWIVHSSAKQRALESPESTLV